MSDENTPPECEDYSNGCKYFHHEPYYTPNNYDLDFDYNSIPVNIQPEKGYDLRNRLQKLMPLTKIIHVNLGEDTFEKEEIINLKSNMKLNYTIINTVTKQEEEKTVEVNLK